MSGLTREQMLDAAVVNVLRDLPRAAVHKELLRPSNRLIRRVRRQYREMAQYWALPKRLRGSIFSASWRSMRETSSDERKPQPT